MLKEILTYQENGNGYGLPKVPIIIDTSNDYGIDICLGEATPEIGGTAPSVFIERRPGRWAIIISTGDDVDAVIELRREQRRTSLSIKNATGQVVYSFDNVAEAV